MNANVSEYEKLFFRCHISLRSLYFTKFILLIYVLTLGELQATDVFILDDESTMCRRFTFILESRTHGPITFKPFTDSDSDIETFSAVVNHPEIAKRTCVERPWKDIPGLIEMKVTGMAEGWNKFLEKDCRYDAKTTFLVWIGCTEDNSPVARGGLGPYKSQESKSGFISELFLHILPPYQHDGIGTLLLAKVKSLFPNTPFTANTDIDNLASQGLLEKGDFQLTVTCEGGEDGSYSYSK